MFDVHRETAEKSKDMSRFSANVAFYGIENAKVNKDDRKKFSYDKVFHLSQQCVNQGQVAVLESMYQMMKEIKADETLTDQNRFDLMLGDIEILLLENVKFFSKHYAHFGRMGAMNIDSLRARYGVEL